ncbi:hypothetical protein CERZMDRAFT_100046 [Cercospora zeae-maydis SCOH1-5]|uniref:Aminoglycoside phosphotransferase domain-containing protein n=1 Tax=Cercospora zeae-maydis SCOH1-5 TaxID=717836 RepID=A0A6A6F9G2_9PEZI|nr:hypothetical protein CERZMDRAFT_100046 [Cercospora zeae-maydis SCOH1-5]
MSRTLQSSTLLEYGSDAVVREQILHSFPIVKVAHPDEAARNRISHEFTMLRILSELKVPTPVFDTQALTDEKGIYRYRMERLYKLDYDKLREYKQDVEYMLRMLHSYGIAFGDLHPGNIMRNGVGELVFIDPSCAGYLEEPVPFFIRPEIYQATTFHQTQDEYRLASYFA